MRIYGVYAFFVYSIISRGRKMEIKDIGIRIAMAIIIGGFIGYEREMRNRPAGFITHILVCTGAAVVSLIQLQMVQDTIEIIQEHPELAAAFKADIGRVVAQVVTGVGFLGAGTIIFDKGSIKGLTTATTIWVVACIGLAIGLGYYRIATISGLGVIFIIVGLKRLEWNLLNRKFIMVLEIVYYSNNENFIQEIVKFFRKYKVQVRDIKIIDKKDAKLNTCKFILYFGAFRNREMILEKLSEKEEVVRFTRK